jgi:hypothetical protein
LLERPFGRASVEGEARSGVQDVQKDMTQSAGMPLGLRRPQASRLMGAAGQIMVVALLALAFFLAPALQGINLEADQSAGANAATRAADAAAVQQAQHLVSQR